MSPHHQFINPNPAQSRTRRGVIRFAEAVVGMIALLSIPTTASAHGGNNDPGLVHACVGNLTRVARVVGVAGACLPTLETAVHWAIRGPQGQAGPTGLPGAAGAPGPTGATGPTGPVGAPGPEGDRGPAGSHGEVGAPGVPGVAGATGATGATGAAGVPGGSGSKGDRGPAGSQGPAGLAGAPGPDGLSGAQGPRGPVGPRGEKGDPGAEGNASGLVSFQTLQQCLYDSSSEYCSTHQSMSLSIADDTEVTVELKFKIVYCPEVDPDCWEYVRLRFTVSKVLSERGAVRIEERISSPSTGAWNPGTASLIVSPTRPMTECRTAFPPLWRYSAKLHSDSLLTVTLDPAGSWELEEVTEIASESVGFMKDAVGAGTTLTVVLGNAGRLRTSYSLLVECSGLPPVLPQSTPLDSGAEGTLVFTLGAPPPTGTCMVTVLNSASGKVYDRQEVVW